MIVQICQLVYNLILETGVQLVKFDYIVTYHGITIVFIILT